MPPHPSDTEMLILHPLDPHALGCRRLCTYLPADPVTSPFAHVTRCDCFDMYKDLVPYAEALSWQKSLVKDRKALIERDEDTSDMLIALQHHPVYTLGTGSSEEYLNFNINKAPHDIYRTDRGGEVTYHGPGQLVMYPIINLRYHKMDLHWYLRALEEVIIRALYSTFSIKASRVEGLTGVWVGRANNLIDLVPLSGDQKLAAIGIKVSQWITHHGLALNVTTDLAPFQRIVPCGIRDRRVGSIKGLLGELLSIDDRQLIDITHKSLLKEFCEVFQFELCCVPMPMLNLSEGNQSIIVNEELN
ncbi:hypothetical protein LguiB_004012 [Lonicera macranthoides]